MLNLTAKPGQRVAAFTGGKFVGWVASDHGRSRLGFEGWDDFDFVRESALTDEHKRAIAAKYVDKAATSGIG